MDRVLGIDYGTRRLGVAVVDPLGITVLPLPAIVYRSKDQALKELACVVQEKNIRKIIFGEPVGVDGVAGTHAQSVHYFAQLCCDTLNVAIDFFSEVMTSRDAETILVEELEVSRAKRKELKDSLAACLILKSYLDTKGWPKK